MPALDWEQRFRALMHVVQQGRASTLDLLRNKAVSDQVALRIVDDVIREHGPFPREYMTPLP